MSENVIEILEKSTENVLNCKMNCSSLLILNGINSNNGQKISCESSICLDTFQLSNDKINPFNEKLADPSLAANSSLIDPGLSKVEKYDQECFKYLEVAIAAVKKCLLGEPKLNLKDYRFGDLGAYLLFEALVGPPDVPVRFLNLSNSSFGETGCSKLSDLMHDSLHLKHLIMSNCGIGSAVELIADGIQLSQSITYLNLSRCKLKDEDGAVVVKAISANEKLKILDLSYNELHVQSGKELGIMFAQNCVLERINLKWNDLFPEKICSVPLIKGLQKNKAIEELDLSWNGLSGKLFAKYFRTTLAKHEKLRILNLESNYFDEIGLSSICTGIQKSKSLEEIYLGRNYWYEEHLLQLMKAIGKNPFLKMVSFGEYTLLPNSVYEVVKYFKKTKPNLKIIFQGKLFPNPPEPVDFRSIIVDRAKYSAMAPKQKKKRRDFGHFMLKLQKMDDQYIKREGFLELLQQFNAVLTDELISHLIEEFTVKVPMGKRQKLMKRVDMKGMAEYYLNRHPTEIPVPAKKKSKKGKSRKK